MKKSIISLFSLALLLCNACNQEYVNPSSGNGEELLKDVNGLTSLANGLQYRYTIGRQSPGYTLIVAAGLSGRELRVLNLGNTDEALLELGAANVIGNNGVVSNLWSQLHVTKSDAEQVLAGTAANIGDPALRSGLVGYASIFKALSLGGLAQFWQQSPINNGDTARFRQRTELLRDAVRTLEAASALVTANAPSAAFTSRIVPGVDIANTLNALTARYSLILGDYDKALAAAARVSLAARSEFRFDDLTRNPIFDVALGNVNVVQPANLNMGLPEDLKPDAADKRIDFYFLSRTPNPTTGVFRGKGFFASNSAPMPVYLPGEMLLIRAEAFARKNDLVNAVIELNKVLVKKPADDAWGLGADLPPYAGPLTQTAILTEIYRNRCIELFMSGLKLEDNRRFERPGPPTLTERNRNFYPYPFVERDNNPVTPADPAI